VKFENVLAQIKKFEILGLKFKFFGANLKILVKLDFFGANSKIRNFWLEIKFFWWNLKFLAPNYNFFLIISEESFLGNGRRKISIFLALLFKI
jgi:hypothetical protein